MQDSPRKSLPVMTAAEAMEGDEGHFGLEGGCPFDLSNPVRGDRKV